MTRTSRLRAVFGRPRLDERAPSGTGALRVRGELDFPTVQQVCSRIEALTIDLSGAWLYASFALDTLTRARKRARRAGCELLFTLAPERRLTRAAVRADTARCSAKRTKRKRTPSTSAA